jgi:hypothetical protein
MPNKTVPGYIQVPVAAQDILRESHERRATDGSATQVTVDYQVRDSGGAVRDRRSVSFQSGAYPTSGAVLLAVCNAQEGT